MMHIRMATQEDAIPVYRLAKDFATSFVVHESAFTHAFKRWTGEAPSQRRKVERTSPGAPSGGAAPDTA